MKTTARATTSATSPANDTTAGPVAVPTPAATIFETYEPLRAGEEPRWIYTVRAGRERRGPVVFDAASDDPNAALYRAWKWCLRHGYDVAAILPGLQARPPTAKDREEAAEAGNPDWLAKLRRAGVRAPRRSIGQHLRDVKTAERAARAREKHETPAR